ncbi:MAG: hypothetical protein ACOY71_10505 [Gemmatimonadota bacterium]
MFIELTDLLRCPSPHDEQFLVLLPDTITDRLVMAGTLGCPVCGCTWTIAGGVADFGSGPPPEPRASALDAEALAALLGLQGPGGYLAGVGAVPAWAGLAEALGGVHLAAINPDPAVRESRGLSVLRGGSIPLKARSVRGVVLGRGFAEDPAWQAEAARVVLPGRHVVGEGGRPEHPALDPIASAGEVWVAQRR